MMLKILTSLAIVGTSLILLWLYVKQIRMHVHSHRYVLENAGAFVISGRTETERETETADASASKQNINWSRQLATLRVLGKVPVEANSTIVELAILSATLVHQQKFHPGASQYLPIFFMNSSDKPLLGLTLMYDKFSEYAPGEQFARGSRFATSIMAAARESVHFVRYASGRIEQFYKVADELVWYANLPAEVALMWGHRNASSETCLKFSVLDHRAITLTTINSCHRAALLPTLSQPYKITFCYATAPRRPMPDSNKSTLGASMLVPQSLFHHFKLGLSQAVVYVIQEDRDHILQLLSPFISRAWVSVVLIDNVIRKLADVPCSGNQGDPRCLQFNHSGLLFSGFTQSLLINDCLNRFKGLSEFVISLDWDEFLRPRFGQPRHIYHIAQQAFSTPSKSVDFSLDYSRILWQTWERPENPSQQLLVESRIREATPENGFADRKSPFAGMYWYGKSIMRPERIMAGWVHWPVACTTWDAYCLDYRIMPNNLFFLSVFFAHFRIARGSLAQSNTSMVEDDFFFRDSRGVQAELCSVMQEVGAGCRPYDWK